MQTSSFPNKECNQLFASFLRKRQLKKLLFRFDSDGDGVVTHRELSQALRFIGFNPTEAELQVELYNQQSVLSTNRSNAFDFLGGACPKLLALFQEVHFWSIKGVLFLQLWSWGGDG